MELGYARVSTSKQDLERRIDALTAHEIATERVYLDKRSGATTDRPGLRAVESSAATSGDRERVLCHPGRQVVGG